MMDAHRQELMPGVFLTCLQTHKFKTACLSVNLLTQLRRESAPAYALIPAVLRRGTAAYPDTERLAEKLDSLYGASIEPIVRKRGEIQAVGLYASFVDDAFLPEREAILGEIAALLGEILLRPNTRGGLLLPQYVDSEKEKLLEQIRGRINEKRTYSVTRLLELMCFAEDYAVPAYGFEAEAEGINYQKLSRLYKTLLATAPIEIFYCGSAGIERVKEVLFSALSALPRGEIDDNIGTDIRLNALEDAPRVFTEVMDVTQGKLSVGFRLGDAMEEPDTAALQVFNSVYGGAVTSKLFVNVREKLSLCYYASSAIDVNKGILLVSSGIEFDKYDAALGEILAQLEAIRRGEITQEELESAKRALASSLRSTVDSPAALEAYYLDANLFGPDCTPEEMAGLIELVEASQVRAIAQGVECDAIYFLRGPEAGEEDE